MTTMRFEANELTKKPKLATMIPTIQQEPGPKREIKPLNMMPEK